MDIKKVRSEGNRKLTQGLFYEFNNADAMYTLRQENHKHSKTGTVYKSLYQLYMDCVDDYDFAMQAFGSMEHFRMLCNCSWFSEGGFLGAWEFCGFKQWQEDKERKSTSEYLKLLKAEAEDGNVTAAKHLFDFHTKGKKAPVGRKVKKKDSKPTSNISSLQERMKNINS